jgi:hypothetical protein
MLLGLVAVAWSQPTAMPVTFHHLHLTGGSMRWIRFYEGLFDPRDIERLSLWGEEALRTGNVLLLASPQQAPPTPGPSAIWHYGWGGVSLGETYLDHNLREVAWEPPLPAHQFHLHLESVTPNVAAAWYRDRLGAHIEFASDVVHAIDRDLRRPMALVRVGAVAMLIYRSDRPLASTRGKQADHLAFRVPDLKAILGRFAAADVTVLEQARPLGTDLAAMVEGPDRVAIELVEIREP